MITKRDKPLYVIIAVLFLALGFMYYAFRASADNYSELKKLNEVANQEIVSWKGKDGLSRAKIEVLETRNTKAFLALETQNETLKLLQSEVKEMSKYLKKKGSVTVIKGETKYDTIYKKETSKAFKDILAGFIMDSIRNPWISSNFGFKLDTLRDGRYFIDTTKFSLKVKNEYSLTLGVEPTGFLGLGKGKPFAQVKNFNPYSSTTDMKTYQVSPIDPKRFGIGVFTGVGVGKDLTINPVLGVGLTYSLIQFRL